MKEWKFIKREEFVKTRYENFLQNKKTMTAMMPPDSFIMTDLDEWVPEDNKYMKDVIICDRCNGDITEPIIIMRHGQYVYHKKCIWEELEPYLAKSNLVPVNFGENNVERK